MENTLSNYVLSCCSTVDLSAEWMKNRNIAVALFNFELGGTWYKDDFGATVKPHALYSRMLEGEQATTSQVSVGEYVQHFKPILEKGLDLVHVTLSSGISQTLNSACLAADQLREQFPERTIRIVDSLCASAGYGLLLDRMADLRDEGMGVNELADWAEAHRLEVNHLFMSSDLTFFVRGGRISPVAGKLGGLLHICPLMRVATDGSLEVMEKIRTVGKCRRRMLERMGELVDGGASYNGRVFISHSDCEDIAQSVIEGVEAAYPEIRDGKVHLFPIGATIGCHTGPGTVALFFWGSPERW